MAKTGSIINRRSVFNSYITTTISITLVIFLLGVMGVLVLSGNKISRYVKENIGFSIVLKDEARHIDVMQLQKYLDASKYVKSTQFISKEEAAETLKETLGEDFIAFVGYNPLPTSIEVKLNAGYANPDSLAKIEKEFLSSPNIKEVIYQKDLVNLVNDNLQKISFVVLLFCGLLFLISVALINNTIRLSVYSKRFLINTMKLVGATHGFIRRPFVTRSIVHGFVSSILAIGLLSALLYSINEDLGNVISFTDYELLGMVFGTMILIGILISQISSFFAVNRYLRMKSNDLYY